MHDNAVRYHLRANARDIAVGLEQQWERAVVLEPDMGILEKRLQHYQEVIDRELAKSKPSNRLIMDTISAAGHDMHQHEANLIRFKKFVTKQEDEEEEKTRQEKELDDMKAKFDNYVQARMEADERINLLEAPEDTDS